MSGAKQATATGVLIVNKPSGMTSHDVVSKLRRLYGMTQIGHTGTLDPIATGVLPILLGRAVKASDYLISEDKEYVAEMTLGITTDTEDSTGNVLTTSDLIPGEERVLGVCGSFVGEIMQTPPMYSAIKVGGKKLYDIAREGGTVEREARRINIRSIEAAKANERVYVMRISCSKGTYVRTLCADIGKALGCGAVMSALCRTRTGPFTLADSHTLDEIEKMTPEERTVLPMKTERLFEDLPAVDVNDFNAKLIKNGNELYQKKLGSSYENGALLRIRCRGEMIALGKVTEFRDGSAIKPEKLFVL